jgi:hypothetical protein
LSTDSPIDTPQPPARAKIDTTKKAVDKIIISNGPDSTIMDFVHYKEFSKMCTYCESFFLTMLSTIRFVKVEFYQVLKIGIISKSFLMSMSLG